MVPWVLVIFLCIRFSNVCKKREFFSCRVFKVVEVLISYSKLPKGYSQCKRRFKTHRTVIFILSYLNFWGL